MFCNLISHYFVLQCWPLASEFNENPTPESGPKESLLLIHSFNLLDFRALIVTL